MPELGFVEGMLIGMERCKNSNGGFFVFDWNKAANLIKEHKPALAEAGLRGDFDCTGGPIYRDGEPVKKENTYTYLASCWATPIIRLDDLDYECFYMENETPRGWGSGTYWPEEALDILNDNPGKIP